MKKHIMWKNTYSQETGFVGKVSKKEGHFINADKEHAKSYANDKTAEKEIALLEEMGEGKGKNNIFEIVEF